MTSTDPIESHQLNDHGGADDVVTTESKLEWVWQALRDVYDPELGLDIVSLGLIYAVRDEGGTVVIDMTLTTAGCPAAESLSAMARYSVAQAEQCTGHVDVRLVWQPPWTPAMIDGAAAAALGFRVRR